MKSENASARKVDLRTQILLPVTVAKYANPIMAESAMRVAAQDDGAWGKTHKT